MTGDMVCCSDDIHVWLASFDLKGTEPTTFLNVLSADEKERADRYISAEARRRFVAARGTLRCLLARYLSTEPADIVFAYNSHGRPTVASPATKGDVVFNLSHSAEKVLYAISGGPEIGVDLERVRSMDFIGISKRFFSHAEAALLSSLPENGRREAFFECWTRKEAFVKAQGTGLHLDLSQVEVSLGPGVPPQIVRIRGNEADAGLWSLYDIDAGEGFKAALAVKSRRARLILRDYPPDTAV